MKKENGTNPVPQPKTKRQSRKKPAVKIVYCDRYVYRSTGAMLTRDSFSAYLAYYYGAKTEGERQIVEKFTQSICDLFSDTHDDHSTVMAYFEYLGRKGLQPPKSIEELNELAEQIDDHLAAAEYLGWNNND